MADCPPFRLYVGDELPDIVTLMYSEMGRQGARVSGNEQGGTFSIALPVGGSIAGSFTVSGKSLLVQVDRRPALLSCGKIESKMQDLILDAKVELRNRRRQDDG